MIAWANCLVALRWFSVQGIHIFWDSSCPPHAPRRTRSRPQETRGPDLTRQVFGCLRKRQRFHGSLGTGSQWSHLVRWFTHQAWWFSIVLDYQRVFWETQKSSEMYMKPWIGQISKYRYSDTCQSPVLRRQISCPISMDLTGASCLHLCWRRVRWNLRPQKRPWQAGVWKKPKPWTQILIWYT